MLSMFSGNKNLMIIALIAMVNALGYGIIIPILYSYSIRFGLSDFQNGLLFASFSICQFASTPIIGRMSDRFGRKPLLVASISGTALSFFLMAFAPSAAFLFLARMLDGITAGNIPVATAVIADTIDEKHRAKGFGIISASFGFGFLVGPAISAATVGFSPSLPFIIAGFITLIAVAVTALFLPETNKHIGQIKHHGKLFDIPKLIKAATDPNVGTTLLTTLFYFLAFSLFIYGFQPYTVKILNLSAVEISGMFALFGAVGLVSQIFFVQRVIKMFGLKKAFSGAFVVASLCYLSISFITTFIPFIAVMLVLGLAGSLIQPLIATVLSRETDAKSQGSIFGLNSSYMSLGQIVGPILGGGLATVNASFPFVASCLATVVCLWLSFRVLRPNIAKESAF